MRRVLIGSKDIGLKNRVMRLNEMRLNEEDYIEFEGCSEWEQKEWCKAYLQGLIEVLGVEIIEEED